MHRRALEQTYRRRLFSADRFGEVEDPFVWKTAEGYEMIAKDMTGKLVGEKHAGVHAQSKDGLHWELAKRPKAWTRKIRWDEGAKQVVGKLKRTFLLERMMAGERHCE